MSYTHQQTEVQMGRAVSVAPSSGNPITNSLAFVPAYTPAVIRAVSCVVTTTIATADAVVNFVYRPTAGSSSGAQTIGSITLPVAAVVGKAYYLDGLNFKIPPGGELVVTASSSGSATGNAHIGIMIEPHWARPEDNSNMIETA